MIRIHLGKEGSENSAGKKSQLMEQLKLNSESAVQVNKALEKVGGISTVILALAVAFLPHLFIDEYKKLIIKQKQTEIQAAQDQLQQTQAQVQQMEPFRKELEAFELQKKNVRDKIETVQKLQSDRNIPVNLLDAVGQSLPPQTWIEELEYQDNGSIRIRGSSLTNDGISDFAQRLAESIYVGEATIQEVGSGSSDSTSLRMFTMTIRSRNSPLATVNTTAPVVASPASALTLPTKGVGAGPKGAAQ